MKDLNEVLKVKRFNRYLKCSIKKCEEDIAQSKADDDNELYLELSVEYSTLICVRSMFKEIMDIV